MKTVTAGRLVRSVIYTPPRADDSEHARQAKQKCSTKARMLINQKAAYQKLKLQIAANFTYRDLHVTLTYDDEHLPPDRASAVRNVKKFLVQLRTHRKARGQTLDYVYVTENRHDEGRLHHHLIINGTGADIEIIRSLWPFGSDVNLETLDVYGYTALAQYLTKEPREFGKPKSGTRMWSSSTGLKKPIVEGEWVDAATTLTAPPGVTVLECENQQNEFGEYAFIEYLLPEPKPRKIRPPRRKTE